MRLKSVENKMIFLYFFRPKNLRSSAATTHWRPTSSYVAGLTQISTGRNVRLSHLLISSCSVLLYKLLLFSHLLHKCKQLRRLSTWHDPATNATFFVLLQFFQTLTNIYNIWPAVYTELINNTIASYLPASPTYCCYTTLGKQVNCIVITLAKKFTHYRCTNFF